MTPVRTAVAVPCATTQMVTVRGDQGRPDQTPSLCRGAAGFAGRQPGRPTTHAQTQTKRSLATPQRAEQAAPTQTPETTGQTKARRTRPQRPLAPTAKRTDAPTAATTAKRSGRPE